jgi:cytosine deaminase
VVAFAQDGIMREPGAERLMRDAMELGADVVGGIPWIESSLEDMQAHIRFCFALATQFGKDVSMLLDDVGDPSMRTLEMMAAETIERGWQGRALAHHCRAMALYPAAVFDKMVELVRRARGAVPCRITQPRGSRAKLDLVLCNVPRLDAAHHRLKPTST